MVSRSSSSMGIVFSDGSQDPLKLSHMPGKLMPCGIHKAIKPMLRQEEVLLTQEASLLSGLHLLSSSNQPRDRHRRSFYQLFRLARGRGQTHSYAVAGSSLYPTISKVGVGSEGAGGSSSVPFSSEKGKK
jgi:hypothetical protein